MATGNQTPNARWSSSPAPRTASAPRPPASWPGAASTSSPASVYGSYAATKFALEAVSDSLRREVGSLGVKIIVVEPGAVTTGMLAAVDASGERIIGEMTEAQQGRYAALMRAVMSQARASVPGAATPEEAGRVIADAIASERPRARYTVGRGTETLVRLTRLLPDRMLDGLLARDLKPHFTEAEYRT